MFPFTLRSFEYLFVPKGEIWTMQKHLDAIKEMQKDKQKELRKKARKQKHNVDKFSIKNPEEENIKLQIIAI